MRKTVCDWIIACQHNKFKKICRPKKYSKLARIGDPQGQIPNITSKKELAEAVERIKWIGDWETDTFIGK